MKIVEIKNLCKGYGNKIVFEDFSLEIEEGEVVALVGESGKGKSTLLNIIGLLEGFDSGDVIIDGEKNIGVNSKKATKILREKIGYIFQNFALVDNETVEYNLNLALHYSKLSKKERESKIEEVLKRVGLSGYEKNKIFSLSGGEQQRVALGRLMLKECKIILADEPTGSLDEENRDLVLDILEEFNEEGKTIIIVTHDKYVSNRCRRIIKL